MNLIPLLLGSMIGFVTAIPVAGPVSAIIFSRGIRGKYAQGRWVALGAGLAESAYALLAFWGLNHFLDRFHLLLLWSQIVAALILGVLGIYFFRSKKMRNPVDDVTTSSSSAYRAFVVGASISAFNFSLLATWSMVVTLIYPMHFFEFTNLNFILFSLGICAGIVAWFSVLLKVIERHRHRLDENFLDRGLKVVGVGLMVLAVWVLRITI